MVLKCPCLVVKYHYRLVCGSLRLIRRKCLICTDRLVLLARCVVKIKYCHSYILSVTHIPLPVHQPYRKCCSVSYFLRLLYLYMGKGAIISFGWSNTYSFAKSLRFILPNLYGSIFQIFTVAFAKSLRLVYNLTKR